MVHVCIAQHKELQSPIWLRREQSLADGFETAYNVMRSDFLAHCGRALAEAPVWQTAEAVLLAIRFTYCNTSWLYQTKDIVSVKRHRSLGAMHS
jgi:hypothetical protein